ncbi:hypothetical protein CP532_2225 [Ophiocordyceps camponoti-leonardi (nom. inval.)]|nr:hypothetical protein CP532_2225 [Ophiocordyceps camponoti-leonardi (nom. inval.)]
MRFFHLPCIIILFVLTRPQTYASPAGNSIISRRYNSDEKAGGDCTPPAPGTGTLTGHGFRRFEWVTDHLGQGDKLARSSAPHYRCDDASQTVTEESVQFLKEKGIKHVISLNTYAESPAIAKALKEGDIEYTPLPTLDYEPVSLGHVLQGVEAFVKSPEEPTLVWCGFGHGRTGTLITAIQMYRLWERSFPEAATQLDEGQFKKNYVETPGQKDALHIYQYILDGKDSMTHDMRLLTGDYFLAFKAAVRRAKSARMMFFLFKNLHKTETKFTPMIEICKELAFAIEILQRFSTLTYTIMSSLKLPIPRPAPRDIITIQEASNMNELTNQLFKVLQEISVMRAFMAFYEEYAAPIATLQKLHDRIADFIEEEHDVVLRASKAIQSGMARTYFEHLEEERIRKGEMATEPSSRSTEADAVSEEELMYEFVAEEAAQIAAKMPRVTKFSPEASFLDGTTELDDDEAHLENESAKAKEGQEKTKTAKEKIALEEKVYGTDHNKHALMAFLGSEAWDARLSMGNAKTNKASPAVGRLNMDNLRAAGEFIDRKSDEEDESISTEKTDVTDFSSSESAPVSEKSQKETEKQAEASEEYSTPSEEKSLWENLAEVMRQERSGSSEVTREEKTNSSEEDTSDEYETLEEEKLTFEENDSDEKTTAEEMPEEEYATPEGERTPDDHLPEQMGHGQQTMKGEATTSTPEVQIEEPSTYESEGTDMIEAHALLQDNVEDASRSDESAFHSTDDWANALGVFLAGVGSVTGARILAHMAVSKAGHMSSSPGTPVRLASVASSLGVSQDSLSSLSESLTASIDVDPQETLALVQQVMEEAVLEAVNNIPTPPMGPVEDRGQSTRLRQSLKKGQMRSSRPLAINPWLRKRTTNGEETAEQRAWKVKRLGPVIERALLRTLIRMLDKYNLQLRIMLG